MSRRSADVAISITSVLHPSPSAPVSTSRNIQATRATPIEKSAIGYVAGLGGRSVLATVNGQQQRANRDLPRELAERTALVEACPTLRDRGGSDLHELIIEDLEGSLDLLLELQTYSGAVAIEWSEGRKLRVSPVTPGKMNLRVGQDCNWFNVDGTVALEEDRCWRCASCWSGWIRRRA